MSKKNNSPHVLQPGAPAPAFTLKATPDQTVSLDDFTGQSVILVFYPADWSPVCGDELALLNQILPEFRKHHAQLLAISVDSAWCHLAYSQNRNLHFPLLADFEPKGEVAKKIWRLSPQRRRSCARVVRDRWTGSHSLELSFADGHQSRCRWHFECDGGNAERQIGAAGNECLQIDHEKKQRRQTHSAEIRSTQIQNPCSSLNAGGKW